MRTRSKPTVRTPVTAPAPPPTFRRLGRAECDALLARNAVGRLAFSFHDRVDVEPLHYVFDGDWLFARTSAGSKVAVLAHHPWVAFEVDEIRGPFDWTSVVARGTVYRLQPRGAVADRARYARGLAALRRAFPDTLGPGDPVAFRQVLLGLHLDEVSGRAAVAQPPNGER